MSRLLYRFGWLLLGLLILSARAASVRAQDAPLSQSIPYGSEVSGEITDDAFFDHWKLDAQAGDRIYIRMIGADGLQPLVGILSEGGTLLSRSDNGQPDGAVELNYEAVEAGTYIVVATRADNEFGTSTGSYTLFVDRMNPPPPTRDPRYSDVTFRCGASEATAVASFTFTHEDGDNGAYSLRVYGIEGFQPVIRVQSGGDDLCITTPAAALGDVITLPGERPRTIADADLAATVEYIITGELGDSSTYTVTLGSANDQAGRYFAVIGGFAVEPSTDADDFTVRLAPRPAQADAPLLFYALGVDNRLDPGIAFMDEVRSCDDAGRRGCEEVPSLDGAGVIFNRDSGVRVMGDRFDAGVQISDSLPHDVQIASFSGTTRGAYALMLIGSLPPRGA